MTTVSQLIAEQANANMNKSTWGSIIVNVKAFGAAGDGVTVDTTAIRAALADIPSAGGILYFPPGTYILSSYLLVPSNVSIVGSGQDSSIIKLANNVATTGFPTFGGVERIILNSDYTGFTNVNITMRNIGVYGNGENQTQGCNVGFIGVKGLTIENCNFNGFGKTGLYVQALVVFGGEDVSLLNSQFSFCSGDGVAIASGTARIKVLGCTFNTNNDYGIAITDNCSDVTTVGNLAIANGQQGIGIDECRGVTVTGNTCRANGNAGIEFLRFNPDFSQPNETYVCSGNVLINNVKGISVNNVKGITVTGNKIIQASGKGIQITDSVEFTVTGNDVSTTSLSSEEGIFLNAQAGNFCGDGLIAANRVKGFTWGVRELNVGGSFTESSIYNNRLKGNTTPLVVVASIPEGNDVQILTGSTVWNPGAIAAGTGITTTFVVSDAAVGDYVEVAAPYNTSDCVVWAWIYTLNGVAIRVQNGTGATQTLASGTWKVKIRK